MWDRMRAPAVSHHPIEAGVRTFDVFQATHGTREVKTPDEAPPVGSANDDRA
jgi:hypothetical protein